MSDQPINEGLDAPNQQPIDEPLNSEPPNDEQLIAGYLSDTLSEADATRLPARLEDEGFCKALKEAALMKSLLVGHFSDDDRLFEQISPSLAQSPGEMEDRIIARIRSGQRQRRTARFIFSATGVLTAAACLMLLIYWGPLATPAPFTLTAEGDRSVAAGEAFRSGERAVLNGSNGEKFTLSEGTRFSHDKSGDELVFFLEEGEVHVDIPPGSEKYRFHAGGTVVKVTGTRFTFAYVNDIATVKMEEGSVEVASVGKSESLTAGQAALVDDEEIRVDQPEAIERMADRLRRPEVDPGDLQEGMLVQWYRLESAEDRSLEGKPWRTRRSTVFKGAVARMRVDYYGVRHTGVVQIPEDGTYTFHLKARLSAELSIEGKRVVAADGGRRFVSARIELEKGLHDFEVKYFGKMPSNTILDIDVESDRIPRAPFTSALPVFMRKPAD